MPQDQTQKRNKRFSIFRTRTFGDLDHVNEETIKDLYQEKEKKLQKNIKFGTFDPSFQIQQCKKFQDIFYKIFPIKKKTENSNIMLASQNNNNTNLFTTQQNIIQTTQQQDTKIKVSQFQTLNFDTSHQIPAVNNNNYNNRRLSQSNGGQKIADQQEKSNNTLKQKFTKSKSIRDSNFLCKNLDYPIMIKFQAKIENKTLEVKVIKYAIQSIIDQKISQGTMVLVQDVTAQSKVSELEELNQYKTKMLASVSHELRTPLNCSLSMLEKLQDQISKSLNIDLLQPALNSSKLLLSLINDILDFSQINAGKFSFTFVKFSLKKTMQEAVRLIQIQAQIKKIELLFEYDNTIQKYLTNDPNRLRQILINLLGNSLKFTKNGYIKLKAQKIQINPLIVQISVEDSGIGIPVEQQEKIFSMFGKVDNKESKKLNSQGCGLGLAISNSLASGIGSQDEDKQQGIKVQSQLGKGSIFSFQLEDKGQFNQDKDWIDMSPNIDESDDEDDQINNNDITLHMQLNQNQIKEEISDPNVNITIDEYQTPLNLSIDQKFLIHSIKQPQVFKQKLFKTNTLHLNLEQSSPRQPTLSVINQNQQKRNSINQNNMQIVKQKTNFTDKQLFSQRFKTFIDSYRNCNCIQVLIVDDNQFNVYAFQKTLIQYFSKIEYCFSGEDCINICEKMKKTNCCQSPLIIFMDVEMPDKNGLLVTSELLNETYYSNIMQQNFIKAQQQNNNGVGQQQNQNSQNLLKNFQIPYIIGCSADNNINDVERATNVGMKNYILKPVKKKELEKALYKYQIQVKLQEMQQPNYIEDKYKFFKSRSQQSQNISQVISDCSPENKNGKNHYIQNNLSIFTNTIQKQN